jgi:hypothetical protein
MEVSKEDAGGGSSGPEKQWKESAAKAAFNTAWDLIDLVDRTPEQEREMVLRAAASRYLWSEVGPADDETPLAVGDWQMAHVLSLLGVGELALTFATASLHRAQMNGWTDWRLASAEEGVARAYAVLGDTEGRDRHAAACRNMLDGLDEEDREIIAGQLASIK